MALADQIPPSSVNFVDLKVEYDTNSKIKKVEATPNPMWYRYIYDLARSILTLVGTGTGLIISTGSTVLTRSLVAGSNKIEITNGDGMSDNPTIDVNDENLSINANQLTGLVTNSQLAGSIEGSKLVGTDITTLGTITTGLWNGSVIPTQFGGFGTNNQEAAFINIGGAAVLVGGTVTVNNTSVTNNSRIFLTRATTGGTVGHLSYTITANTSFTINSSSGTDTSTINWLMIVIP